MRLTFALLFTCSLFLLGLLSCTEQDQPLDQMPLPDSVSCPTYVQGAYCANTCVGFPPINDLGTGYWRGMQGGLYPNGQNVRPSDHTNAGLVFAMNIRPLDINGNVDSVSGKIILLSIGLSNSHMEFGILKNVLVDSLQTKNPYLELYNGAIGGVGAINGMLDAGAVYWDSVVTLLEDDGFSPLQVQAIWFKEAEFEPVVNTSDTTFLGYTDTLKEKFKICMHIIYDLFPNAKLCYLASRIYGGYDTSIGNPEPFAYYTGWAVKRLIDEQINGDASLQYSGTGANSPWLSWGGYIWADGMSPRNDGLSWICPDDFQPDGRHPSDPIGRTKVAQILLSIFMTDETSIPWFLAQ